jgi:DNA repair protein RadC
MPQVPRSAAAEAEDLRERLEAAGAEALDTAECLSFALRRGAGPQAAGWAERLLGEFGSLAEVLGATRVALRRVATPAVARDVEVLQALHLRALREPLAARPRVTSSSDLIAYLRAALAAERREQVRVLFLDHRNRLIRGRSGPGRRRPLARGQATRQAPRWRRSGSVWRRGIGSRRGSGKGDDE